MMVGRLFIKSPDRYDSAEVHHQNKLNLIPLTGLFTKSQFNYDSNEFLTGKMVRQATNQTIDMSDLEPLRGIINLKIKHGRN